MNCMWPVLTLLEYVFDLMTLVVFSKFGHGLS